MAFARSTNGSGGLSINTTSANTTGSSQPPPANSLFGAAGSTSDKPGTGIAGSTSGSLFGASSTSQAQPSGGPSGTSTTTSQAPSLFGAQSSQQGGNSSGSQTNNNQQQQGGSLFGAQPAQQNTQQSSGIFGSANTQQQGGSLFAPKNAQPSQPQQNGGAFGSTFGQSQNQNSGQNQQSGSLFGAAGSTLNKPSLFGSTSNQTQPAQQNQQQTSSLFPSLSKPSNANATQQNSRPSLFGATSTNSAPQQPSLFGGGMSGGLGGSLSLGQSTQQQTVPGVRIDLANLRGTTRFGDLHEELQKEIEKIDDFIQSQISLKEQADSLMPSLEQKLSYVPNDVDFVSKKLDTMHNALENDAEAIDHVRKIVKKDAADAKLSFRSIDNLKLPQQYHYAGLWNAPPSVFRSNGPTLPGEEAEQEGSTDIVSYFSTQAEAMSKTLNTYKQNVREIESHLLGVEASTMQQIQQLMFTRGKDGNGSNREDQVRELVAVLRDFESGILGVAGKVGGVREGVQELELRGQNGRSMGVY
ncbi:MAG: hypothetical protein M1812_000671 [Candelaria pacifica]|nr:MAG: hypothetical protein M1812_000671 [Candelaria pacifica]